MGEASNRALNPDSIKVLVWNIYKGKKNGFYDDFTHYGSDRDILMIQEVVNKRPVMDAIDHFTGFRFDVGISFRYRFKKHIYSGTMIGSHVRQVTPKFQDLEIENLL